MTTSNITTSRRVTNDGGALHSRRRSQQRGVALPMMAMLLAVFMAFVGLVLDGGRMLLQKRRMQFAADAAAWAGAQEILRGNTSDYQVQGRHDSMMNGFDHGVEGVDVQLNNPPTTGPRTTDAAFVEAIVQQPQPLTFMRILSWDNATVAARAVAGGLANRNVCIQALDPTAGPAFRVAGTAAITSDCGVIVNSCDDKDAGASKGGGTLTIGPPDDPTIPHGTVGVCGMWKATAEGSVVPTPEEGIFPPPNIFAARDGLTDLEIAAIAAAHPTGAPIVDLPAINSDTTLFPGHYTTTGGNPSIRVNGGNVTLNAGTYVVDGFTFNGGTITGDPLGVTFYNKGNQLTTIAGTATAILSAPAVNTADPEGDLNYMLLYCHPGSPDINPGHRWRGAVGSVTTGILYCESQHVDWAGSHDSGGWGMIVANTIDVTGNAALSNFNGAYGGPGPVLIPELVQVNMVE